MCAFRWPCSTFETLRGWKAESSSTARKSLQDAATSYSKERTRESTTSTTLPKSKRPEIAGACGRIVSFNFESRLQRAALRWKWMTWAMQRPSCATSASCVRWGNVLSAGASSPRMMVGMDGSVAIKRRFKTP